MSNKIKVHTTEFVCATDIVPRRWNKWFWCLISENAPFTWGDNNRSMVTAECFADHCEYRLEDAPKSVSEKAKTEFMKQLRNMGQMYIDLEN